MLFLVVIIFILCWLPILCYNVAIAVRAVDPYKVLLYPYARSLNTAFSLLAYCNSCLNPIVYGFMSRYFRKSFKQVRIRKHIPYLMYPVTVRVIHSWYYGVDKSQKTRIVRTTPNQPLETLQDIAILTIMHQIFIMLPMDYYHYYYCCCYHHSMF